MTTINVNLDNKIFSALEASTKNSGLSLSDYVSRLIESEVNYLNFDINNVIEEGENSGIFGEINKDYFSKILKNNLSYKI